MRDRAGIRIQLEQLRNRYPLSLCPYGIAYRREIPVNRFKVEEHESASGQAFASNWSNFATGSPCPCETPYVSTVLPTVRKYW